jgi:hypothetical protein
VGPTCRLHPLHRLLSLSPSWKRKPPAVSPAHPAHVNVIKSPAISTPLSPLSSLSFPLRNDAARPRDSLPDSAITGSTKLQIPVNPDRSAAPFCSSLSPSSAHSLLSTWFGLGSPRATASPSPEAPDCQGPSPVAPHCFFRTQSSTPTKHSSS